jgi:two-component system, chemotaxis family, protein-glutamate methylesterase/glutaminase
VSGKIRVLVVDDSAFMRLTVSRRLASDPGIEVLDTAKDGIDALDKIARLTPDVVTLDVEMPKLDGLGVLEQLMRRRPMPVVMLSSLTGPGSAATIKALELGAVDFVQKPGGSIVADIEQVAIELVTKIKHAANARVRPLLASHSPVADRQAPALSTAAPAQPAKPALSASARWNRLLVIGSSTGGPRALHEVVPRLRADLPVAYLIVQHMPAGFTRAMAERLDGESRLVVREAVEGDGLRAGLALVAPGGKHLRLDQRGLVHLAEDPPVNGVRPAIDVTLESAVTAFGGHVNAVILTGMGSDGTRSARALKAAGGRVMAEDESTCVVYGMPRSIVEAGLADAVVPLHSVAEEVTAWLQTNARV